MQELAFPGYSFRLKSRENKPYIFDVIRKKFVRLTPEEWVRQHTLHYLITTKKYPPSLINVEKEILINDTRKRYDIVIFNPDGTIYLIVECKSYTVSIKQETFDQIARYNLEIQASILMVTNGLHHFFCTLDYDKRQYNFIPDLAVYEN